MNILTKSCDFNYFMKGSFDVWFSLGYINTINYLAEERGSSRLVLLVWHYNTSNSFIRTAVREENLGSLVTLQGIGRLPKSSMHWRTKNPELWQLPQPRSFQSWILADISYLMGELFSAALWDAYGDSLIVYGYTIFSLVVRCVLLLVISFMI